MKKGFTLVELLGVIVILGIIGVLISPLVLNLINESRSDVDNEQVEAIKRAAKEYTTAHMYSLNCEPTCRVTIQTLIDEGYLEAKSIKNSTTGTDVSSSEQIEINWNGSKYTYKYPIN